MLFNTVKQYNLKELQGINTLYELCIISKINTWVV